MSNKITTVKIIDKIANPIFLGKSSKNGLFSTKLNIANPTKIPIRIFPIIFKFTFFNSTLPSSGLYIS